MKKLVKLCLRFKLHSAKLLAIWRDFSQKIQNSNFSYGLITLVVATIPRPTSCLIITMPTPMTHLTSTGLAPMLGMQYLTNLKIVFDFLLKKRIFSKVSNFWPMQRTLLEGSAHLSATFCKMTTTPKGNVQLWFTSWQFCTLDGVLILTQNTNFTWQKNREKVLEAFILTRLQKF